MSSIRHFTTEQFSDGTTIDGDRLERSLQDLEDYINKVPDGDLKTRWLQSQIVLKYLPWTAQADAQLQTDGAPAGTFQPYPYLPVYNAEGPSSGNKEIFNAFRFKGNKLDYQSSYSTTADYGTNQVAWTTAFMVGEDPIIIDSVDAILASYSQEYVNTYVYDSSPPDGRVNGQSVNDIHLQITVDNTFIPNAQIQNAVVYHKYGFEAQSYMIKGRDVPSITAFSSDMVPSLDSGHLAGQGIGFDTTLHIKDSDLRIPLPPFSRIRFALILPDTGTSSGAYGTDAAPWYDKPWQTMIPTLTLSILERLKDD
tara:strand:+ start:707 stop:1636 length:930 start_codon:yes stop_codon:yes gene_type:complete